MESKDSTTDEDGFNWLNDVVRRLQAAEDAILLHERDVLEYYEMEELKVNIVDKITSAMAAAELRKTK